MEEQTKQALKDILSRRMNTSKQSFNISEEDAFVLFANYYFANVKQRNISAVAEIVMDL